MLDSIPHPVPTPIDALFVGAAKPLAGPGGPVMSGIVKTAQAGPLLVSLEGIRGDEQGDRTYHGGPEKALHHYASEHYTWWRARYPDSLAALVPGAFGENIASTGMTERNVHIGDIYRAGSVLLQVSQGRQPCWKLNRHLDDPDAARTMQGSGAVGWYYRVLEAGTLARHDRLVLLERPCPGWPLARLIGALFPDGAIDEALRDAWRQAASIVQLSSNWRTTFARRAASGELEDWTRRLHEPTHF